LSGEHDERSLDTVGERSNIPSEGQIRSSSPGGALPAVAARASDARSRQPFGVCPCSWAVRMRACGAACDGVRDSLRFERIAEQWRPVCACCLRVLVLSQCVHLARPVLFLVCPVEPAHVLGRFGCVRVELCPMECGIFCVCIALLNSFVRCARLKLAVAVATIIFGPTR